MPTLPTPTYMRKRRIGMAKCFLSLVAMLSVVLAAAHILSHNHTLLSQILYFFSGWLIWTFIEYMNHRYRMHGKGNHHHVSGYESHMNHHHHPTDIMIKPLHRFGLLLLSIGMLAVSIISNSLLTIVCGVVSGFVIYLYMHVILHQRWSARIFPRLQLFHIHHHCKYPDRCFGVSVTWWDILLNTAPPKQAVISKRIRDFYFGEKTVDNTIQNTISDRQNAEAVAVAN